MKFDLPETLDDLIQHNRELACLRLPSSREIANRWGVIDSGLPIRDVIQDWRLIAYEAHTPDFSRSMVQIYLLGVLADDPEIHWITSSIVRMDPGPGLFLTAKGSIYQAEGAILPGEPQLPGLLHICAAFHQWGRGQALGMPHVFY